MASEALAKIFQQVEGNLKDPVSERANGENKNVIDISMCLYRTKSNFRSPENVSMFSQCKS